MSPEFGSYSQCITHLNGKKKLLKITPQYILSLLTNYLFIVYCLLRISKHDIINLCAYCRAVRFVYSYSCLSCIKNTNQYKYKLRTLSHFRINAHIAPYKEYYSSSFTSTLVIKTTLSSNRVGLPSSNHLATVVRVTPKHFAQSTCVSKILIISPF